jgi:hypothetical protein
MKLSEDGIGRHTNIHELRKSSILLSQRPTPTKKTTTEQTRRASIYDPLRFPNWQSISAEYRDEGALPWQRVQIERNQLEPTLPRGDLHKKCLYNGRKERLGGIGRRGPTCLAVGDVRAINYIALKFPAPICDRRTLPMFTVTTVQHRRAQDR